jgi:hypothetical protein
VSRSPHQPLLVSYWPSVFLCASLTVYLSTAAPFAVTGLLFSVPHRDKIGHSVAYARFCVPEPSGSMRADGPPVMPSCWQWEPHSASGWSANGTNSIFHFGLPTVGTC